MQEQSFVLVNGARVEVEKTEYTLSLLEWLRSKANMLSVRAGCGGDRKCGVCIVSLEGQAVQACSLQMHAVIGKSVHTVEGIPHDIRTMLAHILLYTATVPCGYCTAGLLVKIHLLLQENIELSPRMVIERLGFIGCTCMGVKQIVETVLKAQEYRRTKKSLPQVHYGGVSKDSPRFGGKRVVFGERPFVEDLFTPSIELHGVIVWATHSLFTVERISFEGENTFITAKNLTSTTVQAPDGQEWRIFLKEGDIGYCMSEAFGIVLANSKEEARILARDVDISLRTYEPKTSVTEILRESLDATQAPVVHKTLHYGEPIERLLTNGICTVNEVFYSQPAPYIPLEPSTAVAMYIDGHLHMYTQVADIIWLRGTLAKLLNIDKSYIHCMRTETNVLFDAREDYLVALYAGIASYMTKRTVQIAMSHEEMAVYRSQPVESIHDYTLLLNDVGELIGAKISIVVDGGAYTTDMMRVCDTLIRHATSGFLIQNVDLSFVLVSTNTTPRYMPRGKCLEASCIVMNRLLDKLSKLTRFNRYELRAKNLLRAGEYTLVGEYLYGDIVSTELLQRAKELYTAHPSASLSFSFIDTGLTSTNAMCMVAIDVIHGGDIVIYQPYPDYGNGITTLIAQTVIGAVGMKNYNGMTIRSTTDCMGEMQTIPSSETAMMYLVYHAIREAIMHLKRDLKESDHHSKLWGKRYVGIASISSEPVYSIEKEPILQGSYTGMMHVARCEEPYIFSNLVVLVDAGLPFNPTFATTLVEGGISFSFTAMVGSKDVGQQPIKTQVEFICNNEGITGYSFKGVYDASVVGLASSYYSFMWSNHKKNIAHYPLS